MMMMMMMMLTLMLLMMAVMLRQTRQMRRRRRRRRRRIFIVHGIIYGNMEATPLFNTRNVTPFSQHTLPGLTRLGWKFKVCTLGSHDAKIDMLGSGEIARVNQL